MVVIVFCVFVEMTSIQTIKKKLVCVGERERILNNGVSEDVIKMAADRQDGGRERKLV
jgi:hypothetical protein